MNIQKTSIDCLARAENCTKCKLDKQQKSEAVRAMLAKSINSNIYKLDERAEKL